MTRKSITTSHAVVACDVCGRTLLRGENADVFLAGGSRRMVCELCTPRATHEGWIREGLDTSAPRRSADRRGRSLLGRIGKRRNGTEGAPGRDELPPGGGEALVDATLAAARAVEAHDPPAPRERRSVHAVPTNRDLKMARAAELFNGSEQPRKVAGITRSLGAPFVVVRPSTTEGSVVSIVVAWELSWYRYEVDLADEAAGVRIVDRGTELAELDDDLREPNGAIDDAGHIALAST